MEITKKRDYIQIDNQQIPRQGRRSLSIDKTQVSLTETENEDRVLEFTVSSDLPYKRWFYYEILDHSEEAVDLSRFNDGANVLFNHNRDDYIGIIQRAWLAFGKLHVRIRFDTHPLAERIYQSVKAGIIRNVSIGYTVEELILEKEESESEFKTYRATLWTPLEASLVTVPADASVGIGRSIEPIVIEEKPMEKTIEINEVDIKRQERDRINSIMAAGAKYKCIELARRAVDEDMSLEQARSLFLDHVRGKQEPVATLEPVPMSDKERSDYRFLKAAGYAAGVLPAKECGLELEVSREIEKRIGKPPSSRIYVDPTQLVSFRAPYDTQTALAAGNLIDTRLLVDRFINALRVNSAFIDLGITVLNDLTGNIEIPREATYPTAYWVGEGQVIPEDEGTFDRIIMTPKKLAVITKVTLEMIVQAALAFEVLLRDRLIKAMAQELDRVIGFGSGVGEEPLGIISHPEVNSIDLGANGGQFNWDAAVNMIAEVDAANALNNSATTGFVVNSRTKAQLQKTLDHQTGAGNWIWQPGTNPVEGSIAGYRARCSNQIPNNLAKGTASNLSAVFFGDFSQVLMGIWNQMEIMANPYSEFDRAIVSLRALQLVDVNVTRGDFFCVATDVQNT